MGVVGEIYLVLPHARHIGEFFVHLCILGVHSKGTIIQISDL